MKMPRAEEAVVPPDKISKYLLNLDHPIGGPKAVFFRGRGFKEASQPTLADSLIRLAMEDYTEPLIVGKYGITFHITGRNRTPDRRGATVLTAWMIRPGEPPKLVTAYPSW